MPLGTTEDQFQLKANVELSFDTEKLQKDLDKVIENSFGKIGDVLQQATGVATPAGKKRESSNVTMLEDTIPTTTKTKPVTTLDRDLAGDAQSDAGVIGGGKDGKPTDGKSDPNKAGDNAKADQSRLVTLGESITSGLQSGLGVKASEMSGPGIAESVSSMLGSSFVSLTGVTLSVAGAVEVLRRGVGQFMSDVKASSDLSRLTGENPSTNPLRYGTTALRAGSTALVSEQSATDVATGLAKSGFRGQPLENLTAVGAFLVDKYALPIDGVIEELNKKINNLGMSSQEVVDSFNLLRTTAVATGGSIQQMFDVQSSAMKSLMTYGINPKVAEEGGLTLASTFGGQFRGEGQQGLQKFLADPYGYWQQSQKGGNISMEAFQKDMSSPGGPAKAYQDYLNYMLSVTGKESMPGLVAGEGFTNEALMRGYAGQDLNKLPIGTTEPINNTDLQRGKYFLSGETWGKGLGSMGEAGTGGILQSLGGLYDGLRQFVTTGDIAKVDRKNWSSLTRIGESFVNEAYDTKDALSAGSSDDALKNAMNANTQNVNVNIGWKDGADEKLYAEVESGGNRSGRRSGI